MSRISSKAYLAVCRNRLEALSIPEPNSGCWLWLGSIKKNGYGNFSFGGKFTQAHRASFSCFVGPIPDGLQVLHSCDNPSCINPDHLRTGTQSENMEECVRRGRRAKFHRKNSTTKIRDCPVGVGRNSRERKWKAWLGKTHLGYFRELDRAIEARKKAEQL